MGQLASYLPSLNSWELANLALFTEGIVKAESCQQEQIARQVACGERPSSAARRLRRFIANQTMNIEDFFVDWTRWIVTQLARQRITLLVDETNPAATCSGGIIHVSRLRAVRPAAKL